jgi:nicotinamidase-related amidase
MPNLQFCRTHMINIEKSCLVVVDVQGKLAQLMHGKDVLFKNIQILIRAAQILNIPILWCQQCPYALGPTVPDIARLLTDNEPIDKAAFSCCGAESFNSKLNGLARDQILLCGIETHVCIYQTAIDLLRKGFEVGVIADAVSSRALENKQIALQRMAAENAKIYCTEMALFELLQTAEHPRFREIAKLIK